MFVLQAGGEPVQAFLALLEVYGCADSAQGVVEEHGQEPVPGVAAPVALGGVRRGAGGEHVSDRGSDALARTRRRAGLGALGGRVACG